MNSTPIPSMRCGLAVLFIAAVLVALCAPGASAADPVADPVANPAATVPTAHRALVLPALDMSDIVHDRRRLIQFSVVAVALGIALLWWGNKSS